MVAKFSEDVRNVSEEPSPLHTEDRTPFITTGKINPTELPTVKVESVVFLETLACLYQTT